MHSVEERVLQSATVPEAVILKSPVRRYENIDALRAIAALAVFVQHFFGDILREATDHGGVSYFVSASSVSYFDAGRFGVVLFFLISGLVVPFSIKGNFPLHRFAISRFFRLFPAMWLALFCLAVIGALHGKPPSVIGFLANMTMVPSALGQPWMSGAYWTLTIEIVFYVLSAGLFAFGLLYRPVIIACFAILLALATAVPVLLRTYGVGVPVQYISLHVSFLYLGLLLRLTLVDRMPGAFWAASCVLCIQAAILLGIGEFSLARQDGFFLVGKLPILTSYVAALCVFLISVKTSRPQNPLLSWLGALSYSIYLFHGIVALLVFEFLPLTGTWIDLPVGLVSLGFTLVLSHFVYECLEKKMINLGYIFIKREDNGGSKIASR